MRERLLALRPMLLRVIGYPAFFLFWFFTFMYWTFPYDRLREMMVGAVEAPRRSPTGALTASNMTMSIGDLGPTFFPGLRARDVSVTFLPTHAGDHPITMHMDRVTVHVSLFSLLARNLNADISIDGLGGSIEGNVQQALAGAHPGLRDLKVSLTHVRAGDFAPLVSAVGLPLSGSIGGTVEIHIPQGRTDQANGAVQLGIDDLRIGDGHAQYQIPHFGGITIEQIRAGRMDLNVTIRDGRAQFDHVAATSNEFHFAMDGSLELRPVFEQSEINAGVRFQLTDAYRHKSEQAGRILSVLDMAPDLQRARRPDGMYGFRCTGSVERMRCPPDVRGGMAPGRGFAAPPGGMRRGGF